MTDAHLRAFEDRLCALALHELTPNNIAEITKTTMLNMLDPKFKLHTTKVRRAFEAVSFNKNGILQNPKDTYRKINSRLRQMRDATRVKLHTHLRDLGSFSTGPALSILAKRVLQRRTEPEHVEVLCSVIRQTAYVFKDAFKATKSKK